MMVSIKKIIALICLFSLPLGVLANNSAPTLVLVHGALFTSSGWFEVQSHLQNAGYNVVTLDVPGRADDGLVFKDITLASAADKVCKVVQLQKTPVVLIGHSQGGAVITQALQQCGNKVKGLIYVTAVVPLNGETGIDGLSDKDKENFDKNVTFDEANSTLQVNYNGPIKEMFMADTTDEQFKRALNTMVSEPANIGVETLHYPEKLFLALPKFYIEATQDKIISLTTQKKIQDKVKFKKVYTLQAGHSPMISQSKALAAYVIDIMQNL